MDNHFYQQATTNNTHTGTFAKFMISASDLLTLPFTPDLAEGGITFALRSMAYSREQTEAALLPRLRQIVGSVAVELAFRRYLTEKGVPFLVKAVQPFSEPDRYEVSMGGRRCSLNTGLISRRSQISAMRRNPETILLAPASISESQISSASHTKNDIHIFAFLPGLATHSPDDIAKAVKAGQQIYLLHSMRTGWSTPQSWGSLGKLGLKSECSTAVQVEIGGLDAERNFIFETLPLNPLSRVFAANNYFSLAYVHVDSVPNARIGLHSPSKNETYLIQAHEWGNIWVYGLEIWLAGYVTQEEFRRKASTTFSGSRVFQYSTTQTKSLSLPLTDLHPLNHLIKQVIKWQVENRSS